MCLGFTGQLTPSPLSTPQELPTPASRGYRQAGPIGTYHGVIIRPDDNRGAPPQDGCAAAHCCQATSCGPRSSPAPSKRSRHKACAFPQRPTDCLHRHGIRCTISDQDDQAATARGTRLARWASDEVRPGEPIRPGALSSAARTTSRGTRLWRRGMTNSRSDTCGDRPRGGHQQVAVAGTATNRRAR